MYFQRTAIVIAFGFLTLRVFHFATAAQESAPEPEYDYSFDVPEKKSVTSGGALFIRWGRTVCPYSSRLVYKGVIGGGHYKHHGSGSNYVCLPRDPVYASMATPSSYSAIMYGTEYQRLDGLYRKPLEDHDIPCAVCLSRKTTQMMIPGRNRCYPGWHAEYKGYLVAQRYDYAGKTEFVCLDASPEMDHDGYRNDGGALMYQVKGSCGALPCPPYIEGKALTCVVCTI